MHLPLTPRIRDFLVELEDLLDRTAAPALDRDRTEITTGDAVALVRLAHRTGPDRDVELQVDDRVVIVSYGGEPLHLRDRAFALQFVEALLSGRVDIEVHRGLLWRTTRSYLDESPRPFLVTRMPVPSLSPRIRAPASRLRRLNPRRAPPGQTDAFFTSGSIFTPGPIVDDVVMPLRYRPFADGGFARWISSRTAP